MQKVNELTSLPLSRRFALAGFWLAIQAFCMVLYLLSIPDFVLVHDIKAPYPEYEAWVAAISLLAVVVIAIYEKRTRKKLLFRVAMVLLGLWAAAFIYLLYFVPFVMIYPA